MITKTGSTMIKEALIISPIIGAIRAGNLARDEREALEKKYDLPENANLGWRNAGRGILGAAAGRLAGVATSALLGGKLGKILPAAGYITGLKLMTDKYSSGNARKINERNKKPDVPLDLIAQKIKDASLEGDAAKGLLTYYAENERARKEAF